MRAGPHKGAASASDVRAAHGLQVRGLRGARRPDAAPRAPSGGRAGQGAGERGFVPPHRFGGCGQRRAPDQPRGRAVAGGGEPVRRRRGHVRRAVAPGEGRRRGPGGVLARGVLALHRRVRAAVQALCARRAGNDGVGAGGAADVGGVRRRRPRRARGRRRGARGRAREPPRGRALGGAAAAQDGGRVRRRGGGGVAPRRALRGARRGAGRGERRRASRRARRRRALVLFVHDGTRGAAPGGGAGVRLAAHLRQERRKKQRECPSPGGLSVPGDARRRARVGKHAARARLARRARGSRQGGLRARRRAPRAGGRAAPRGA